MTIIAVIDDWQGVAAGCADWSMLDAEVRFHREPFASIDAAVAALVDVDVIVPMRERLRFDAPLIARLPRLKLLALTGFGTAHVDVEACTRQDITLVGSGSYSPAAAAELSIGLMIAAARHLLRGDAETRAGRFQSRMPLGMTLAGRTLGIVGVGKIGSRVAAIARAIGMEVIGWSPNLTPERAMEAGVRAVAKEALFHDAAVISLHMPLSPRSAGIVDGDALAAMKPGAILVNTSRAGLVDKNALITALQGGHIVAALDVFDREPLQADDPLLAVPNLILTPHIGFNSREGFEAFYRQSVENIRAWSAGTPIRVISP